jgi:aspartyl-tRNA(Asn)/glutamyl-tRNA(Gln) amidotransferase subunit C
MPVSREDVLKIARLAKISLSEDEIVRFTRDFQAILTFVESLKEAPLDSVEPLAHPLEAACPMRGDERAASLSNAEALRGSPRAEGGTFRVPDVIEGE